MSSTLLRDSPSEVLSCVVGFLDGKSLSTVLQASCSCPSHRQLVIDVLFYEASCRLDRLRTTCLDVEQRDSYVVDKISLMLESVGGRSLTPLGLDSSKRVVRILSNVLAFLDFVGLGTQCQRQPCYQCPVWCGQMKVRIPGFYDVSIESAIVEIRTPYWTRALLLGRWRRTMNVAAQAHYSPERRNYRILPPIGQVSGLRACDQAALSTISAHMSQNDVVFSPTPETLGRLPISSFLVAEEAARNHVPPFLRPQLDPYGFHGKFHQDSPPSSTVYCLWESSHDDEDFARQEEEAINEFLEEIVLLMRKRDSLLSTSQVAARRSSDEAQRAILPATKTTAAL